MAAAVAALAWRASPAEGFIPLLFSGAGAFLGTKPGQDALNAASGGRLGGDKGKGGGNKPTYVGRNWTGVDWACPHGTIETGQDNSKACISSPFHPQMWRWDGKEWAWSCPNGTTPSTKDGWDEKCEVGHMVRVKSDDGWQCPSGTTDTGKTWENSTWHEAHKQCKRGGPYTVRIKVGGKWQCPPFSQDTGRTWESQTNQWDQCKWTV